jgi:hypothetical protein
MLCAGIAGHPDTTPRGYFESISRALQEAGYAWQELDAQVEGNIPRHRFVDQPAVWSPFLDELRVVADRGEVCNPERMLRAAQSLVMAIERHQRT